MHSRRNLGATALLVMVQLACIACRTPGAAQDTRVSVDTSALRAELEQVNAAELEAVRRGDAQAAASHYTQDALLLPPDGGIVRGRPAITAFWDAARSAEITDVQTRTLAAGGEGGTAFLSGEYRLTTRAGTVSTTSEGTMLLVFRREGATWRIALDMWTARTPAASAP